MVHKVVIHVEENCDHVEWCYLTYYTSHIPVVPYRCVCVCVCMHVCVCVSVYVCVCVITVVLGVLLYGSETWTTTRDITRKLESFHNRCLRGILGITYEQQRMERITSIQIAKRFGMEDSLEDTITARRLRWLGHLARMEGDRVPKKVLMVTPPGSPLPVTHANDPSDEAKTLLDTNVPPHAQSTPHRDHLADIP